VYSGKDKGFEEFRGSVLSGEVSETFEGKTPN